MAHLESGISSLFVPTPFHSRCHHLLWCRNQRDKPPKFIPLVCEINEFGEPYLPAFLTSRIWIDFSSPENVNANWEKLLRALYGKPAHEKPTLGKPPMYITVDVAVPASPAFAKFAALKQAIIHEKRGLKLYRTDFLDACYEYADALRVRERPDVTNLGQRVLEDCVKLKLVRDQVLDWVLLESGTNTSEKFGEALVSFLERMLELKSRPAEMNSWNDVWLEAHCVFVYEMFLYVVAALLKNSSFYSLDLIFTTQYLLPETEGSGVHRFRNFQKFHGRSDMLQILAPEGKKLLAPAAELIKRHADRIDIRLDDVMQSELLVLMKTLITRDGWWYPQTLLYSSHSSAFPFFLKASRHRDFQNLAKIMGIDSADELRTAVKAGHERLGVSQWHDFWIADRSFMGSMNLDGLDTLK